MSFNDAVVEKERAVILAEDSEPQLEVEEDTFSHDIIFTLPMVLHSSFILHKVFISLSNFDLKQR